MVNLSLSLKNVFENGRLLAAIMETSKLIVMLDGSKVLAFANGFCPLANHYRSPFKVRGQQYLSVQQYVESKKAHFFSDYELRDAILKSKSAKEISGLVAGLKNFDAEDWARFDKEHMWTAIAAKLEAHKAIATILKATGDVKLAYANRYDDYLGTGCAIDSEEMKDEKLWSGKNVLGELLMEKRRML